jgi:hypothetical protein
MPGLAKVLGVEAWVGRRVLNPLIGVKSFEFEIYTHLLATLYEARRRL